jgi:hypothetical protein
MSSSLPLKPIINSTYPVEIELKTDNELEKSNNLTPIILLETIQIKTNEFLKQNEFNLMMQINDLKKIINEKCASDMLEIKCEFENGLIKEIKDLKLKLKKCEKKS